MENKYYETIVKLIQNHKKYPGLEAILDDIVTDVQDKAKVVMANVTNTEVVETYLAKIVSSSIITVPKKLNFNTSIQHRIITNNIVTTSILDKDLEQKLEANDIDDTPVTLIQDEHQEEQLSTTLAAYTEPLTEDKAEYIPSISYKDKQENVNVSLVDRMINGVTQEELETDNNSFDINTIESITVEETADEVNIEEINEEETIELTDSIEELPDNTIDEKLDETVAIEDDFIELIDNEDNEDIALNDEEIIEKTEDEVINIEEEETIELTDNIEELPDNTIDEKLDETVAIKDDFIELIDNEDNEDIALIDEEIIEKTEDEVINIEEEEETIELTDSIEELPDNTIDEKLDETVAIEDDFIELIDNEDSEDIALNDEEIIEKTEDEVINIEEEETIELTDSIEELHADINIEEFDTSDDYLLDTSDDTNTRDTLTLDNTEIKELDNDTETKLPNYNIFNYEPKITEYDIDEIMTSLKELDFKKPNAKILEIFNLKYKQNLSVKEIANSLNTEVDFVLETLSEIIDTVKD